MDDLELNDPYELNDPRRSPENDTWRKSRKHSREGEDEDENENEACDNEENDEENYKENKFHTKTERVPPETIAERKKERRCYKCGIYGHYQNECRTGWRLNRILGKRHLVRPNHLTNHLTNDLRQSLDCVYIKEQQQLRKSTTIKIFTLIMPSLKESNSLALIDEDADTDSVQIGQKRQ
ncbi:hypothetical protein BGX38DRAFT_1277264 [Terfezia claveryi]|nr:hypothetical protein BGX38DRAFT_1277264 [Terfezia claveryi]